MVCSSPPFTEPETPLGNQEHRVPLGLSSLNILAGHPLVEHAHKLSR